MPWQFGHPANPEIHRRTTAEEIWRDTNGVVDAVVLGVGTGGTLTGVRRRAQGTQPRSQDHRRRAGKQSGPVGRNALASPYPGIGAGFVPDVSRHDFDRRGAAGEQRRGDRDVPEVGSAGGHLRGHLLRCRPRLCHAGGETRRDEGPTVVTILPSGAERYLSPLCSTDTATNEVKWARWRPRRVTSAAVAAADHIALRVYPSRLDRRVMSMAGRERPDGT